LLLPATPVGHPTDAHGPEQSMGGQPRRLIAGADDEDAISRHRGHVSMGGGDDGDRFQDSQKSGNQDAGVVFDTDLVAVTLRAEADGAVEIPGANRGEMLAIARALVSGLKVMLLDEPSQGLAPLIVPELARVIRLLCDEGVTILLVEQNMKPAEAVADELHMVKGRMAYRATPPSSAPKRRPFGPAFSPFDVDLKENTGSSEVRPARDPWGSATKDRVTYRSPLPSLSGRAEEALHRRIALRSDSNEKRAPPSTRRILSCCPGRILPCWSGPW
jgi:hypothetical protein